MSNWTSPCPNCPRVHRAIGGDGPQPSPILGIAERPGDRENRYGRVLVGPTGQETDELYLPLAGLDRANVRLCNTVMCFADNNKTPTDKDIARCAPHHIPAEIERTKPEIILLLGSSACSLVPGINLELQHGIPQHTSKVGTIFGWSGWLVPLFHPAIGLHESRWMKICMDDWATWQDLIGVHDPEPERTSYHHGFDGILFINTVRPEYTCGIDTESHGGKPWSVQISTDPGTGVLFKCDDPAEMMFCKSILNKADVVLHNSAYDLEVLRTLGITVRSYRDTMQEAFHLGDLPQGLKALAYRLFRHTMTSYNETVRPASIRSLTDWMLEAYQLAQSDLSIVETVQLKTKTKTVVKKGPLESLLTRLLRLTVENSAYDPWERLDTFYNDPAHHWMLPRIESRCGPYPILGIGNCTMREAVQYAVGDADWTARVAVELERRRSTAFHIHAGDRDVSI